MLSAHLSLRGQVPLRVAVPTGGALESTPASGSEPGRPGRLVPPAERSRRGFLNPAARRGPEPCGHAKKPRGTLSPTEVGGRPPAISPTPLPSTAPHFQPVLQKSFPLLWLSGSNQNPALGRVWRMMDVRIGSFAHLIGKHRPSPLCFSL